MDIGFGHKCRLTLAVACCAIAGLAGLAGAAVPLIRPGPDAAAAGILLPPFDRLGAMQRIAASGLPIVDMRLGGRLVIVMLGPDGSTVQRLGAAGLIVIAAEAPVSCNWNRKET